jgi:hypothetical protein
MATKKVGVYKKYHGTVPKNPSGQPLPKSQWPKVRCRWEPVQQEFPQQKGGRGVRGNQAVGRQEWQRRSAAGHSAAGVCEGA